MLKIGRRKGGCGGKRERAMVVLIVVGVPFSPLLTYLLVYIIMHATATEIATWYYH
jgi:hypothetical protein